MILPTDPIVTEVEISPEAHDALEMIAKEKGLTASELVSEMIEEAAR